MPFGKGYGKYGYRKKKPYARKRKSGKMTLASKVMKIVKKHSELKWFDVVLTPTTFFAGGSSNQILTNIPQSAGASNASSRIGDEITITSCKIHCWCYYPPDATNDPSCLVRVIVYQYKPNDGLLPPNATRLLNVDDSGTPNVNSFQNMNFIQDYHILYDRTQTLVGATAAGGVDNQTIHFRFNVPMSKVKKTIGYNAGLTAGTNNLYMAIFSNSSSAVGVADPLVALTSRVRFLDA